MAYNDAELYKTNELGQGLAEWEYHTLDAAATVAASAYFTGEGVKKLKAGSLVNRITWATAIRTGTISTYGKHIVLTNDGTTVDLSDATAGVITNT